jgi:[CysO sulfur-carrier protein]-S-L-cysteine hydrolase
LEVPLRRLLEAGRAVDGGSHLVVIPAEVRSQLVEHAEAERPNEACGLIAFRDGVAERYVACVNTEASPYRFNLRPPDPDLPIDLEDEGFELAVFHSHLSSPPRPSRTDVENIGLWVGRPYVILSLHSGELAAWRIADGRIDRLQIVGA